MPLREDLLGVGERIVNWFRRPSGTNDPPPYQAYVYPPKQEWEVRHDLGRLRSWLQAPERAIPCVSLSLAELFWQAIDETGWTEELFAQEREAAGDPTAQAEVHRAVAELLRAPTPFSERVIGALGGGDGEARAVFLYRAGSLYPMYRTSALLDDLRPRLCCPVTLLYPGIVEGDFGLKFMGRWEPTYNYRALIVVRSNERG